jgi:hypothetical protein
MIAIYRTIVLFVKRDSELKGGNLRKKWCGRLVPENSGLNNFIEIVEIKRKS